MFVGNFDLSGQKTISNYNTLHIKEKFWYEKSLKSTKFELSFFIYSFVFFWKDIGKGKMIAWINFKTKLNLINVLYVAKLGF